VGDPYAHANSPADLARRSRAYEAEIKVASPDVSNVVGESAALPCSIHFYSGNVSEIQIL
jgi:hypothetical protein